VINDENDRNYNPSQPVLSIEHDNTVPPFGPDPLESSGEADSDRVDDSDIDGLDEDSEARDLTIQQPLPIQREIKTRRRVRRTAKYPLCDTEKLSITGSSVSILSIKISNPFEPSLRSYLENLAQACN